MDALGEVSRATSRGSGGTGGGNPDDIERQTVYLTTAGFPVLSRADLRVTSHGIVLVALRRALGACRP